MFYPLIQAPNKERLFIPRIESRGLSSRKCCKKQKGSVVVSETFHERAFSMKRYILTGTPGSGKTSLLHELKSQGYSVVEEAATDVIALEHRCGNLEPWMQAD